MTVGLARLSANRFGFVMSEALASAYPWLKAVHVMAVISWMAGMLYDLRGSYTLSFLNAIAFILLNEGIASTLLVRARREAWR